MPRQGTTGQRGYNRRHRTRSERLRRTLIDGTPCWWCGEPMYRTQQLALDHETAVSTDPTSQASRVMHFNCNSARGDGSRDHLRPAITGEPAPPDPHGPPTRRSRVFTWH